MLDYEKHHEIRQNAQTRGNKFEVIEMTPDQFYGRITVKCRPQTYSANRWKKGSPIMLIAEKYMQVEGEEIEVVYEGVVLEANPREVTIVFNERTICDFQEGDTVSLQDLSKFL